MRRPTDDKVLHHARCNVYCYPDEPDMSLERRESPTRRSEEGVDLRRRQLHRLRPLLSRVLSWLDMTSPNGKGELVKVAKHHELGRALCNTGSACARCNSKREEVIERREIRKRTHARDGDLNVWLGPTPNYGRRPALTDPSLPRSISSTLKSGDFLATRRAWGLVLDLYNDDHWLLNRLDDRSLSPKRDE